MSIDRPREQHEHDTDESPGGAAAPNTATNGSSGTAAHEGASAGPDSAASAVRGDDEPKGVEARGAETASAAEVSGTTPEQDPIETPGQDPAANPEPEGGQDGPDTNASTADSSDDDTAHPGRTLPVLLTVAAVAFALDLGTKTLVVAKMKPGEPISIIGQVVQLTLTRNAGAAFSMATGMTWLLTLIAAAVVIGVIRIGRSLRSMGWAVGLGLVLGGALGNLMDRLFRSPGPLQGHVVDFVAVTHWWPIFNVADSCIVCGAILLVVLTVFGIEPDSRHNRGRAAATEVRS